MINKCPNVSPYCYKYLKLIRPKKLYEEINIFGVRGLISVQEETLKIIGAIKSC